VLLFKLRYVLASVISQKSNQHCLLEVAMKNFNKIIAGAVATALMVATCSANPAGAWTHYRINDGVYDYVCL